MRGGPRTKRRAQGQCMAADCSNPIKADNFCRKHYLQIYFSKEPGDRYERGRRWFRRNSLHLEICQLLGLKLKQSEIIVNTILKTITDALNNGEIVSIPGFGTFYPRSPYGTKKHQVKFEPHRELLKMVNQEDSPCSSKNQTPN